MGNPPNIRFKGFTDDWEQRKLMEVAEYRNGKAHENEINDDGEYIVVNSKFVSTNGEIRKFSYAQNEPLYENEIAFVLSDVPNGRAIARTFLVDKSGKYTLNQRIAGITPHEDTDPYYLYIKMNRNEYFLKFDDGNKQTNLSIKDVLNYEDMYPSYKEQQKIGMYFQQLDHIITLHQRKCDETKKLKKFMLQKMFPKKDAKKPEIRFVGFTNDWEQRKVSDVAKIIAGGTPSTKENSYWEPKEIPWLSSGEVHKKYITFTDDMISQIGMNNSSAKMVAKDSVLIALAGQGKTRGTVAINRIPLTTNQSIAAMTFNENFIPEFVFYNLENRYDELRRMSSGDGSRGGLNKQLVGDIEIPYTEKKEQERIGSFFESLDRIITLHQRKCDELKEFKKYMLQNMFPQKG